MINIATLTGHCAMALGENLAGIFSNNDELTEELKKIGEEVQVIKLREI